MPANISLSETALQKLTQDEVIAFTLEYQAKFDNTLFNINRDLSELRNDFKKVESELSVSRNVKSKLRERVVALERERECVMGIISILDANV